MTENAYEVPKSVLTEETSAIKQEFYIVSRSKFIVLYLSTLGVYANYWSYRNWKHYKLKNDESLWPVVRGFFDIFFVYSLFSRIEFKRNQLGIERTWSPNWLAGTYILLTIIMNISNQLSEREIGSPYTDFINLIVLIPILFLLLKVQDIINIVEEDPSGSSNSQITMANGLWIGLGIILWLATIIGYLMLTNVITY